MELLTLFGPLDALEPYVEYVVFALVLANLVTRQRAHFNHVRQADASDADEKIARSRLHESINVVLLLTAFYYATVDPHGGVIMSVLVAGMVVTDFFEFEARRVEARNGRPIDLPKGAIVASVVVLLYAAYQALFHFIAGPFGAIV